MDLYIRLSASACALLAAIAILAILTTGFGAVPPGQKPPVQHPAIQKTPQVKGVATQPAPSTCRSHSQTRHSLHKRGDYENDLGIDPPTSWREFQESRGTLLVAQDDLVFPVYSSAGPGLRSIGTSGLDGGIIVVAANAGYGMVAHVSLAQYWDGRSAIALRRMFHDARYVLKDTRVPVMRPTTEVLGIEEEKRVRQIQERVKAMSGLLPSRTVTYFEYEPQEAEEDFSKGTALVEMDRGCGDRQPRICLEGMRVSGRRDPY